MSKAAETMIHEYWKKCDLCKRPVVGSKPLSFCANCTQLLWKELNNPKSTPFVPTGYTNNWNITGQIIRRSGIIWSSYDDEIG